MEQFSVKTNWRLEKDSCTTKTVRKIYTGLGREGREVIRLGHAPLGGDTEKEGDYTG